MIIFRLSVKISWMLLSRKLLDNSGLPIDDQYRIMDKEC